MIHVPPKVWPKYTPPLNEVVMFIQVPKLNLARTWATTRFSSNYVFRTKQRIYSVNYKKRV